MPSRNYFEDILRDPARVVLATPSFDLRDFYVDRNLGESYRFTTTNSVPLNTDFTINLGGKELIRITRKRDGFHVEAESLAGASEAALVFVEGIKDHLGNLEVRP